MEEAWTYTQSTIDSILDDLETNKQESRKSNDINPVPRVKYLMKEDEEQFEGFGAQKSTLDIGSVKINFLKSLSRYSSEHKNFAISFRSSNNDYLRVMWKKIILSVKAD